MAPRLAVCVIVLAVAWMVGPSGARGRDAATRPQPITVLSTAEMEKDLYQSLHAERAARRLQAVRVSPRLAELARQHSAEMARRDALSHESETGTSYQQRLGDAGVSFVVSGENVARSGASQARIIHQSFMQSAGHRDNLLNPAFDTVGIGVMTGRGGTYYVTVDFIRSLTQTSSADIRAKMLGALNDARARAHAAPVVLTDAVNGIAEDLAHARAGGRDLPRVPLARGRTSTRYVTSPDLDQLAASIREIQVEGFSQVGVGSAFRRSREFPGGAYVICILFVWNGS